MKRWLENNEIFFKIISSVLIGSMAVIVSIASYIISDQELQVSRASLQPNFFIKSEYLLNKKTGHNDEIVISVHSAGNHVYNPKIKLSSFLNVEIFVEDRKFYTIHLNGYFDSGFESHQRTGELITFKGIRNNQRYGKLYREVWNSTSKELQYFDIKLFHIIRIKYIDKLGNKNTLFFRNQDLISPEAGKMFFDIEGRHSGLNLDAISVESLLQKIEEMKNK